MININSPTLSLKPTQVLDRVLSLAHAISRLRSGDIIGLYVESSEEGVLLLLASIKLGLKVALCPLREPPKIIDEWLGSLGVRQLFSSSNSLRAEDFSCEIFNYAQLKEQTHSSNLSSLHNNFSTIIRSSGSTSIPKSALIDFKAHESSARAANRYFAFNASSWWLLSLPLYHVGGLAIVMRALCSGGGIFIAQNHEQMLEALQDQKVSHCSLVPAQLKRLIREQVDLSKLNAVVIGGDALGARDREQALAARWPIYETYGLTETASMVWVNDPRLSQGMPLSHMELRLADDGEILVRGESLFSGYVAQGQPNPPVGREGFFHTEDIGHFDERHQLKVIGRKNNRIISGGENIQAEEIERVLELHPHIDVCVVVGVEDEKYGSRPIAFVKWLTKPLALNEIGPWLLEWLPSYKRPDKLLDWPKDISSEGKKPRALFSRLADAKTKDALK